MSILDDVYAKVKNVKDNVSSTASEYRGMGSEMKAKGSQLATPKATTAPAASRRKTRSCGLDSLPRPTCSSFASCSKFTNLDMSSCGPVSVDRRYVHNTHEEICNDFFVRKDPTKVNFQGVCERVRHSRRQERASCCSFPEAASSQR
jgi:hypothetical protein